MLRLLFALLLVSGIQGLCPPGNYYGPCLCILDSNQYVSLECTGVTDGDELFNIFATINETYLASVDINNSPMLLSLPDDLFGDVAVGALRIRNTGLSEVQYGLIGSPASTSLQDYYIRFNSDLLELKGESILGLTSLSTFQVTFNGIVNLTTPLPFSTVTEVILSNNQIKTIAESYFKFPGEIYFVDLSFNNLATEDLVPNSLDFHDQVNGLRLDLSWNLLSGGIPTSSLKATIPCQLILSNNGITSFSSAEYASLLYNMLFEYGGSSDCYIKMTNNPLNCDCSIEWLVDADAKDMVVDAVCDDGRAVADLTSADFVNC